MNLNRKLIAGVSGLLVTALAIGLSSGTENYNIENGTIRIQASAGVNAAVNGAKGITVAGASNAVEGTIGIVDADKYMVGQAVVEEELLTGEDTTVSEDETDENLAFETFGYTNLGMVVVDGNLNIREFANTDSSIVGKMTNHSACEILAEVDGFYQITSGNAEGYVSKDYILTGKEALALAQQEASEVALVMTDSLRVRESATTDSKILSTVSKDEELDALEISDGWVKVEVDSHQGYVSADYVTVTKQLKTGNTMTELKYGEGVSDVRVDLVNYALQFVGNRYVWGGESLTKGVDCSGFTMKIYEKYGIYLPHYSGSQPSYGKKITRDEIRPGDLIFYGEGRTIDHVAIYIGNGQIVHAANERAGIKISRAFYRSPICIVSYLN